MKQVKLLVIFFMLSHTCLLAQSAIGIITFGKRLSGGDAFGSDTVADPAIRAGLDGINGQVMENIDDVEYTLTFSKNEALFEAVDKLDPADPVGYTIAKALGKDGDLIYLNLDEDIVIDQKELEGDTYAITSKLSSLCWSLQNETKQIGKYTCYKATTVYKRQVSRKKQVFEVTAWYVPELSFRFGPVGFGNLPGLILELSVGKVCFYMKDFRPNLKLNNNIKRPQGGKVVTEQEYYDIQDKIAEDFFNSIR